MNFYMRRNGPDTILLVNNDIVIFLFSFSSLFSLCYLFSCGTHFFLSSPFANNKDPTQAANNEDEIRAV